MESKNLDVRIFTPKKSDGLYYVYIYDKESQEIIQKYYKGINTDPDPSERLSAAEDMQKAIKAKIKLGWMPKDRQSALPTFEIPKVYICDALDQAIISMRERLERKTVQCYGSTVNFFKDVVLQKKWHKTFLHDFETIHIEEVMKLIGKSRKWSNNEYNKNITYIKAVFTELVRMRYLKINPAHGILSRKKERRIGYEPLTDQEQTRVIQHFQKIRPNYAIWLKTLYHTGIRPAELRLVRCSMVNIDLGYFQLTDDITKTDDNRKILIPEDLKMDLIKFDLSNKDYFLFGKSKPYSYSDPNDFKPSKFCLAINSANKMWKTEVIDYLKINKKMYSQKHKKANDIIMDGGSLEAVQRAFGHSNKITTEIYAKMLGMLQLEEFKDKARDFK